MSHVSQLSPLKAHRCLLCLAALLGLMTGVCQGAPSVVALEVVSDRTPSTGFVPSASRAALADEDYVFAASLWSDQASAVAFTATARVSESVYGPFAGSAISSTWDADGYDRYAAALKFVPEDRLTELSRARNWVELSRRGQRLDLQLGFAYTHSFSRRLSFELSGQVVVAIVERTFNQKRVAASKNATGLAEWASHFLEDAVRPAAMSKAVLRYDLSDRCKLGAYAGYRADFNRASLSLGSHDAQLGQARFQGGFDLQFLF